MAFRTSDTPLAAYLITLGNIPTEIVYSSPPRYEFVFGNPSKEIEQQASLYTAGLGRVEPIIFNRLLRKLTRIMHAQGQWGED